MRHIFRTWFFFHILDIKMVIVGNLEISDSKELKIPSALYHLEIAGNVLANLASLFS